MTQQIPAKPSEERKREAAQEIEERAARPARWVQRWGDSPIDHDPATGRWTLFEDPEWGPYPTEVGQQETAALALHVMGRNALVVRDEQGEVGHWRRFDPASHTWKPLSRGAIRALVTAISGGVKTNAHVNGAMALIDSVALGPPISLGDIAFGRPHVIDAERLDDNPRYRACQAGVVDLDHNEIIDDPARIDALDVWLTRSYPVPVEIDCDLEDPDIAERMEFVFDGFLCDEDETWFWDQAGYTGREQPSRRIVVVVGPPGAGKSTKLMALVAAEGDFAQDGRISDLAARDHEPRFSVRRAWCEAPFVGYDDGPDGMWKWSIILPASAGAIMPCEIKNGGFVRLPSISTPWIAMNPGRLKWVGVNTEGGPERLKILRLKARTEEETDPEEQLREWGYSTVQEMVTKDQRLHMGIVARRIRHQALNARPPSDTDNVKVESAMVQTEAHPPFEAWAQDLFVYGKDQSLVWDAVMERAAAEHPEGSEVPWRLDTDDSGHKWLTIPKKGRGSERINSTEVANRVRELLKADFREHGVESGPVRIDGKVTRRLKGVGMRPPAWQPAPTELDDELAERAKRQDRGF